MANVFTGTDVALAMFKLEESRSLSSAKDDAIAALKAFDFQIEQAERQEERWEQNESLRNLPVERMRRGEVAPEHMRTVVVRGGEQRTSPPQNYAIPANSDPLQEMFKGQDIQIRSMPTRTLRIDD